MTISRMIRECVREPTREHLWGACMNAVVDVVGGSVRASVAGVLGAAAHGTMHRIVENELLP